MTWDGKERRRGLTRQNIGVAGPYIAICAVVILGFFVQGSNTARIEREAQNRDRAICEDSNERSASVRVFVRLLVAPEGANEPATEEGREIIALADEVFAPKNCDKPRESPPPE